MGANTLDTTEADALISVYPNFFHAPAPNEGVEIGRKNCQILVVETMH